MRNCLEFLRFLVFSLDKVCLLLSLVSTASLLVVYIILSLTLPRVVTDSCGLLELLILGEEKQNLFSSPSKISQILWFDSHSPTGILPGSVPGS
jgi:hypothetical protein